MINYLKQVNKFYKHSINDEINKLHFIKRSENTVTLLWTDFEYIISKDIEMTINNGFSTDFKDVYNLVKGYKTITDLRAVDNRLYINGFYVNIEPELFEYPEQIQKDKFDLILKNVNIKVYKTFVKAAGNKSYQSLLKHFYVNKTELVATDLQRFYSMITDDLQTNDKKLFIDSKLISNNINKTCDIYASDNFIKSVNNDNTVIVMNKLHEQNLQYKHLLPAKIENKTGMKIKKDLLLNTLKMIKKNMGKSYHVVVFDFNNNQIKFKDESGNLQTISYVFEFTGDFGYIAFNVNFLIDFINFVNDDLFLNLSGVTRMAITQTENKTAVIMPISIRDNYDVTEVKEVKEVKEVQDVQEVKEGETVPDTKDTEAMEVSEVQDPQEVQPVQEVQDPQPMAARKQINAVTRQEYHGSNVELLQNAGYSSNKWVGEYQARKLNKQVKRGSKGYVIKIKCTDKNDDRPFYILQTVYNTECLEPLQKVEDSSEFTEMLERLEA